MSDLGDLSIVAKAPGEYWNNPQVVQSFATVPLPGYLADLVPPAPGRDALAVDIGCGGGRNLALLAQRGYRFIAVDLHESMLETARKQGVAGGCYVQADVVRLPFGDASSSVLVCHGVLHNLPDRSAIRAALGELRRIAAPSSVLSLNLFSSGYLDPALRQVSADKYALNNGQQMTLLDPADLSQLCAESGWQTGDGPHQYLSPGDPGQRSVWRAVLEAAR